MSLYTAVKSNGQDLNIKQGPRRESPKGKIYYGRRQGYAAPVWEGWRLRAPGRGGLFPTDGVPRTTVSLTGAQLHHSVPIKSSFLDECLCQAGPDASETCNYSWLPTPTASAPVPVQGTSWPCLASCLLRDGRGASLKIQAHATHFLQNAKTKQKI